MPNLVGTGLNQVPTNGMLGGLAYQSPDHASIKDLDLKYLSQINSEIADTAVDVFVYDTSRDTDGGAWRQRTQHTSWYNETLNTETRGSRREFPAVAVIVAELYKVTIYDGDDPDLPMWMVFDANTVDWQTDASFLSSTNISSVKALNGNLLCVGLRGVVIVNFIDESQINRGRPTISATYALVHKKSGSISSRNDNSGQYRSTITGVTIEHTANDVAMTVLPTAPIDPDTGLQVPTIAVATNGGVSVIKDDGSVVDSQQTQAYSVTFRGSDIFGYAGSGVYSYYTGYTADGFAPAKQYWSGSTTTPLITTNNTGDSVTPNSIGMNQSTGGLVLIDHNTTNFDDGMVAYATTSYNTGWQHGAIKGAFLSDTDATNVTAPTEYITNGTFGTGDLTGWTNFDSNRGTLTYSSGKIRFNNDGVGDLYAKVQFTSSPANGATLHFGGDVTTISGNNANVLKYYFVESDGTTLIGSVTKIPLSSVGNGVFSKFDVVVPQANTWGMIVSVGSGVGENAVTGDIFEVDNVSLKVLEEADRSVNNKGLQVFGTVNKTAVATGAELVAYSGFTNSIYLKQPVNTDLPSNSTDTFSMMAWVKTTTDGTSQYALSFGEADTNKMRALGINFTTGTLIFSSGGTTLYGGADIGNGQWQFICCTYNGSGVAEIYVNGTSIISGSVTLVNSTSPTVIIGNNNYLDRPFDGSISLARISASAPSAEQIKKIYEDEKVLFQENANATLHGSSDAVTALAYDEKTNLLHVGTSSGRSDFNGLRRINNTTEAVTTAISAYDGSIAQQ